MVNTDLLYRATLLRGNILKSETVVYMGSMVLYNEYLYLESMGFLLGDRGWVSSCVW